MDEIKNQLEEVEVRFEKVSESINRDSLRREIRELEAETMKEGFWSSPEESSAISRKLSDKQKTLTVLNNLESRINNAIEISEESSMQEDLKKEVSEITKELDKLEHKITNLLESRMIYVKPAIFQQLEGFNSSIPINQDRLLILMKKYRLMFLQLLNINPNLQRL